MKDVTEITDERVAALLDGRLGAAERDALLSQIAESEEWREVLADAIRANRAEDVGPVLDAPIAAAAPAVGSKQWSAVPRWMPIAAGIVVLAGGGWWISQQRSASADDVTRVVASLGAPENGLPAGWNERPWSTSRGETIVVSERGRAVRTGALLTDLRLAVQARDTTATGLVLRQLELLLADVPGSAPARRVLGALADQQGNVVARAREAGNAAAGLVGENNANVGAWLEGARVAATTRDAAFFARAWTRELAKMATSAGADSAALSAVGQLQRLLASPSPRDWAELRRAIDASLVPLAR